MFKEKKGAYVFVAFVFATILIASNVNAGINDWFKELSATGRATQGLDVNVTVGAGNAPVIVLVYNASEIGGTLNEGPSQSNFVVNFAVEDANGVANIDDATAAINFSSVGEDVRYNQTCIPVSGQSSGINKNYTCTVHLWWWDGSGTWAISANISDLADNVAINNTKTFQVAQTTGFVLGPGNITYATLTAGTNNQTSNNDPLVLNNTGNKDIVTSAISFNITDLRGEVTSSQGLYTTNFSIGNTTGSSIECGALTATTFNYTNTGGAGGGEYYVNITTAVMNASNYTINNGREGQEQLYFCIRTIGSELSSQSYSASGSRAWGVQIV